MQIYGDDSVCTRVNRTVFEAERGAGLVLDHVPQWGSEAVCMELLDVEATYIADTVLACTAERTGFWRTL